MIGIVFGGSGLAAMAVTAAFGAPGGPPWVALFVAAGSIFGVTGVGVYRLRTWGRVSGVAAMAANAVFWVVMVVARWAGHDAGSRYWGLGIVAASGAVALYLMSQPSRSAFTQGKAA